MQNKKMKDTFEQKICACHSPVYHQHEKDRKTAKYFSTKYQRN